MLVSRHDLFGKKLSRSTAIIVTDLQSDMEASLRDARTTIADLERQVATLRKQKSEDSQSARDSQDLRKQLDELKDRNTALEEQLIEYTKTIQDHSKVGFGLLQCVAAKVILTPCVCRPFRR